MITLENAKKALEVAENKARELGVAVTTVIVDDHGTPLAMSRMDGAITISPKFAQTKAYTSASLGAPTSALAGFTGEGKPYAGLTSLFGGELTTMAGGVPVMMHGKLVGGIGVGGSQDVSQDEQCAMAAKAVLEG